MKSFVGATTVFGLVAAWTLIFTTTSNAQAVGTVQERELSRYAVHLDHILRELEADTSATGLWQPPDEVVSGPDDIVTPGGSTDDGFGGDPSDDGDGPIVPDIDPSGLDLPYISRKSGAADIIAYRTLQQTLLFYGVVHTVERNGSRRAFKVIQSKSGYFKNLTTLDIAFAVRTFSQFLVSLMCNNPTQENVARLLTQIPKEQIGLRFKYDMAWALLGNYLPRQASDIYKLGERWRGLSQILGSTRSLNGADKDSLAALKSWMTSIGDVVNIISRLNKMMCFVDVRPDAREEIKKRMVVKSLLDIDLETEATYGDIRDAIEGVEASANAAKLDTLRQKP